MRRKLITVFCLIFILCSTKTNNIFAENWHNEFSVFEVNTEDEDFDDELYIVYGTDEISLNSGSNMTVMGIPNGLGDDRFSGYSDGGDYYSSREWASLSEAKSYYGRDFTYYSCSHTYKQSYYNYFYSFSDNTRCYFFVKTR